MFSSLPHVRALSPRGALLDHITDETVDIISRVISCFILYNINNYNNNLGSILGIWKPPNADALNRIYENLIQ